MQWSTGSAWSSAGASLFPPWRAAFTVRLVSGMVVVSLPLKIRTYLRCRSDSASKNGPDLAYENGLNPVSF